MILRPLGHTNANIEDMILVVFVFLGANTYNFLALKPWIGVNTHKVFLIGEIWPKRSNAKHCYKVHVELSSDSQCSTDNCCNWECTLWLWYECVASESNWQCMESKLQYDWMQHIVSKCDSVNSRTCWRQNIQSQWVSSHIPQLLNSHQRECELSHMEAMMRMAKKGMGSIT